MTLPPLLADLLAWWQALPPGAIERQLVRATLLGLGLLVLIHGIERRHRLSAAPYLSRGFAHDVAYWFYYRLGLHYAVFLAVLLPALMAWLPAPDPGLLGDLPFALQALVYFALVDLCVYWIHRAQHRFRWLWAFHSVHHSQTQLTFATSQRVHPLDHLLQDLLMFVPLRLLGFHEAAWLPLYIAGELALALQHSRIPWTYGPLYRVLVSPVFHRYHHAADPAYHHTNFAGIFSAWDYVFGTAAKRGDALPDTFGVAGVRHDTLLGTLVGPFRQLFERAPAPPAPEPERPILAEETHVRN